MKLKHLIFLTCLILIFVVGCSVNQNERVVKQEGFEIINDIDYVGDGLKKQTLDLFYFNSTEKVPLIIFVHGGGWKKGGKGGCMAKEFLKEGYAVACLNYRLSDQAKFPAQIQDVKAAVRLLRANADKYNLDSNKFAAWGDSAGGHLVSLLGTSAGVKEFEVGLNLGVSSQVQFVVDWYGPTDPIKIINLKDKFSEYYDAAGQLLGDKKLEEYSKEKIQLMNPINYVDSKDPTFLIIHGDKDRTVPVEQSREFYQALKKAGVKVTYQEIKGEGHGGIEFESKALPLVKEFFKNNLK